MPLRVNQGTPIWTPPPVAFDITHASPDEGAGGGLGLATALLADGPHSLDVPFFRQQQDNWCWAACMQMVMHYLGETGLRQCEVVSVFLEEECCTDPDGHDVGCDPEDVEVILARDPLLVSSSYREGTIKFNSIKEEVDVWGRPVIAVVYWYDEEGEQYGGHMFLIKGWHTVDNRWYVKVNDPLYGRGNVPYFKLFKYYGPDDDETDGAWEYTWTGIRRA